MRRLVRAAMSVTVALSTMFVVAVVAAPPASADIVPWQCDDGGGGITGYTPTSHCQAYTARITGYPMFATVTHSDEPPGPIDTLTVTCFYWCGPPPAYTPPPPPSPEQRCGHGSGLATDAGCGVVMPLDSPENKQALQAAYEGGLVAGPAAPLGTPKNPLPLPAGYKPPPIANHVWGDATGKDSNLSVMIGCLVGGGAAGLVTHVLNNLDQNPANDLGLDKAIMAGCASGGAANSLELVLYKDRVRIWYPTDITGRVNEDPNTWYKCTDFKLRRSTVSGAPGAMEHVEFQYPAGYPELGGQHHNFARSCVPYTLR